MGGRWHSPVDRGFCLLTKRPALDRLSAIGGQLSSPKLGKAKLLEKNPDDVRRIRTLPRGGNIG